MPKSFEGILQRDFKLKGARLEEADGEGTFRGRASVYGVLDSYGTRILPGAFSKSVGDRRTRPLLWAHRADEPIGIVEIEDRPDGLHVTGRLNLEVGRAREVRALMQQGAVEGLSVGFIPRKWNEAEDGTVEFQECELVEVSATSFPANSRAKIEDVRSRKEENTMEFAKKFEEIEQKLATVAAELRGEVAEARRQIDAAELAARHAEFDVPGAGQGDFAARLVTKWQEVRGDYERGGRVRFEVAGPVAMRAITRPATTPAQPDSRIGAAAAAPVGAVLELIPTLPISAPAAYVMKEQSASGWAAGVQAEGAAKTESTATFAAEIVPVRTLATWAAVSRQMLDDFDGAQGFIRARLEYALLKLLENEILNGDGTGERFEGLIAQAATWTAPNGVDLYGFLANAAVTVEGKGYRPQAVILNPADALKVRLQRDTTDQYVQPPAGVPAIVTSPLIAAGSFLIGDFSQAVLRMRQPVTIDIAEQHSDYFTKNLVAIRAEMRGCLVVYSGDAFLKGTLPA
jgi:HK97 family phage prohead protease